MNVLYFHQHFSTPKGATGTRSYEMAKHLVERGHDVTMVCGSSMAGRTGLSGEPVNGLRRGRVDGIEVMMESATSSLSCTILAGVLPGETKVSLINLKNGESATLASGQGRIQESLNPVAIDCVQRFGRTIEFAGHTWGVKEAPDPVGPGSNRFSSDTGDVFVDDDGLHLTIQIGNGPFLDGAGNLLHLLISGRSGFYKACQNDSKEHPDNTDQCTNQW